MQLTFGNMTLELNIFHLSNKHKLVEDDNQGTDEVCSIDPQAVKPNAHKLQELVKENEAIARGLNALVTPADSMISPTSPIEKKFNKNESVKLGWFGLHKGQTAAQKFWVSSYFV